MGFLLGYLLLDLFCFLVVLYIHPQQFMKPVNGYYSWNYEPFIGGIQQVSRSNDFAIDWVLRFFAIFPLDLGWLILKAIILGLYNIFNKGIERQNKIKQNIKDKELVLGNLEKEIAKAKKELQCLE